MSMPRNRNQNRDRGMNKWWNPHQLREEMNPDSFASDDYSMNPDSFASDAEESYGRNPSPLTQEEIARRDDAADRLWHRLSFMRRERESFLSWEREELRDLEEYKDRLDRFVREYRRKSQYTEDREFICEKYEECEELDKRIKHMLWNMELDKRERDSEDAVIRRLEIESWQYDMEAAERRGLRALGK